MESEAMSERTSMDRYLDRLERLLTKCIEADNVRRRERRRSGRTLEQEMMDDYERWKRRRKRRPADPSEDDSKH